MQALVDARTLRTNPLRHRVRFERDSWNEVSDSKHECLAAGGTPVPLALVLCPVAQGSADGISHAVGSMRCPPERKNRSGADGPCDARTSVHDARPGFALFEFRRRGLEADPQALLNDIVGDTSVDSSHDTPGCPSTEDASAVDRKSWHPTIRCQGQPIDPMSFTAELLLLRRMSIGSGKASTSPRGRRRSTNRSDLSMPVWWGHHQRFTPRGLISLSMAMSSLAITRVRMLVNSPANRIGD